MESEIKLVIRDAILGKRNRKQFNALMQHCLAYDDIMCDLVFIQAGVHAAKLCHGTQGCRWRHC